MSARHVRPNQFTHLGIDPGLDPLYEQPLPDLLEVVDQSPGQRGGGCADEVFELDAPERVVQAGLHHAEQLPHPHVPAQQTFLGEDDCGEAGDQSPVQVEERPDPGPGWAGHDLGDRTGQPHVRRRFLHVALGPPLLGCAHDPDTARDADAAGSPNEAGAARGAGSPASARISSKPSSRHWANNGSSRIAALS